MIENRKEQIKNDIRNEYKVMEYKNHVALNGLLAYQKRLRFLIDIKPARDIEVIKINELAEHAINKCDIDISTISDFSIQDS